MVDKKTAQVRERWDPEPRWPAAIAVPIIVKEGIEGLRGENCCDDDECPWSSRVFRPLTNQRSSINETAAIRFWFPAWLHRDGRCRFIPREIQHEAAKPLSGELSYGDWNGGHCRACSFDQARKSDGPNQSFTVGCSHRA